jgi:hypothetical protein
MHVAVDGLGRPTIVKQEDAFSSPCCDSRRRRIRPPPPPAKLADIFRAARRLKSDIVFWDDKRSGAAANGIWNTRPIDPGVKPPHIDREAETPIW